jgi:hypothetical protein
MDNNFKYFLKMWVVPEKTADKEFVIGHYTIFMIPLISSNIKVAWAS